MSKTVLSNVDGFLPVIDAMIDDVGLMTAAVFSKVWRYCQMKDGTCTASQSRMAGELGITRETMNRHIDRLVVSGYLEERKRDGFTSELIDTGKANLTVSITGGVINNHRGCEELSQGGVIKTNTKIQDKIGEENNKLTDAQIFINHIQDIVKVPLSSGEQIDELEDLQKTYPDTFWEIVEWAGKNNPRSMMHVIRAVGTAAAHWTPKKKQEVVTPPAEYVGEAVFHTVLGDVVQTIEAKS